MARRSTIGENPLDALIPVASPAPVSGTEPVAGVTSEPPATPAPAAVDDSHVRERVTLHLSRGLLDRVRNAVYWTPGLTMADLAEEALSRYLALLEEERGGAFPPRASELKRGRPIR